MKTITRQILNALLVSALTATAVLAAPATHIEPGDSVTKERSFDVGIYMSPEWKINLRIANHQRERVTITMRNAHNTILYQEHVKRGRTSYWRKFDFNGSEPGVYVFEVKDGQQTIVRQVEIVDMPAVDSQRYITYGPDSSQ